MRLFIIGAFLFYLFMGNRPSLTKEQKSAIWACFMGPYDNSLIDSKGRANNTDKNIASVVGVPYYFVSSFLDRATYRREKLIYELRSKDIDDDLFKKKLKEFDNNISDIR